ncbi:MAG: DUF4271 domain-containing protein [Paludibacteraceae bacterium]|nr:DUF4271 domain-containing protein [Paludibacteraceae bacterium]
MPFIPHISSLLAAPWSGWLMLCLLLSAVIAEVVQPGVVTNAYISLVSQANRTYHVSPRNFFGQLFVSIFRVGVGAMALCMCFYTTGGFKFRTYMAVFGLIVGCLLVKMLLNKILEFTYSLSRQSGSLYEHYGNILTMIMLVFYPCQLVLCHWYNVNVNRWIFGVVIASASIAWLVRCFRTYVSRPVDIFYVILYFATIEVLPLCGIIYITSILI